MNIVLARYNENVNWVNDCSDLFDNIYLFNKGNNIDVNNPKIKYSLLPNIGREAHTYLYFIVNHYEEILDNQEQVYIFSQADPNNGLHAFKQKIEHVKNAGEFDFPISMTDVAGVEKTQPHLGSIDDPVHPTGVPFAQYFNHLFYSRKPFDEHKVYYNALWATKGRDIVRRKREFYQYCLNMFMINNPIESYIFERLWQYIFTPSYLDWISHYDVIRNMHTGGRWHGLEIR